MPCAGVFLFVASFFTRVAPSAVVSFETVAVGCALNLSTVEDLLSGGGVFFFIAVQLTDLVGRVKIDCGRTGRTGRRAEGWQLDSDGGFNVG